MESAEILSSLLDDNFVRLNDLEHMVKGKEVLIIGDSPYFSIDKNILKNRVIITADDATSRLLDIGHTPQFVFTDLDSSLETILEASMRGSIIGVHAHGDNIKRLNIVNKIDKRFGTTQAFPLWNVYNFGGFTDGDRAVFFAEHFKAQSIIVAGFNFYDPNQRKGKDLYKKFRKLLFSRYLLYELMRKSKVKIIIL
ncbi:MAG: 6-hydroxymethylpterin diphosphokinase MptE-like protein [Thermoplasmata archaeon]